MVICQHWQVKAVTDVCSKICDRKGKNYGYFRQLQLVSSSILPTSNRTQRWNSAVRPHLFEWIIAFIWINYRSIDQERERDDSCVRVTCVLRVSLQTMKCLVTSKTEILHIVAEEYNVAFYYLGYFINNSRGAALTTSFCMCAAQSAISDLPLCVCVCVCFCASYVCGVVQYRRSLYAEYTVGVGHQLPGGAPSQLLKKKSKKYDAPFPHSRPHLMFAAECKWS